MINMKLGLAILLTLVILVSSGRATHEITKEEEALKLVSERCILCHYLDRPELKFAPSLKDLYKRENGQLMNGKPVNDQTVYAWIAEGSPNMPAFKHSLRPEQIQLIVTFLKEGKAASVPMIRNSR
jgi:mono/diheme cytochrome c family protein